MKPTETATKQCRVVGGRGEVRGRGCGCVGNAAYGRSVASVRRWHSSTQPWEFHNYVRRVRLLWLFLNSHIYNMWVNVCKCVSMCVIVYVCISSACMYLHTYIDISLYVRLNVICTRRKSLEESLHFAFISLPFMWLLTLCDYKIILNTAMLRVLHLKIIQLHLCMYVCTQTRCDILRLELSNMLCYFTVNHQLNSTWVTLWLIRCTCDTR